jgi:hypothetical protein
MGAKLRGEMIAKLGKGMGVMLGEGFSSFFLP